MELESVQSRFDRKWSAIRDDRKVRGWDSIPQERKDAYFPGVIDPGPIDPIDVPNDYESTYSSLY